MPTLETRTACFIQVDYRKLNEFIREVYGIPYFSCLYAEDWNQGEDHHIRVLSKRELNEWDLKKLQEVKDDQEPPYCMQVVMQDLVNRDLIPPGNYLISDTL